MSGEIRLPSFQHIDTELGLKYLNNNKKLYLKILTNFLNRYQDLVIEELEESELRDTIHAIKGLSATLGMVKLSQLATTIHQTQDRDRLSEFSYILALVIDELDIELNKKHPITILIINTNVEVIDMLIENLDNEYDIIVALDIESAIESLKTDNISLVLLDEDIEPIDILHDNIVLTTQPFNINQLKNDIKIQLKF